MEKRILLTLLLFILMINSASAIKIVSLNIQSGVGTTKGYWQYLTTFWKYLLPHSQEKIIATSELINSENIDIIAFTEIDASSFRSNNISQVELISNLTNLKEKVFFSTHKLGHFINQGNAILTRYPILTSKAYRLPGTGEPRYLGEVLLDTGEYNITVFITHLSLSKNNRNKQIDYISKIVNATKGPVILTGDFNTNEESEISILKQGKLTIADNCKTYPSWNPKRITDYFFLNEEFNVKRFYVEDSIKVSDHLPCIADVVLN